MATSAQSGTSTKKTTKSAPAATAKPRSTAAAAKHTTSASGNRTRSNGSNGAKGRSAIDPEQRRNYIEVAAYYIAERRGFTHGNARDDWAAAEMEIDRLLAEGKLNG